MLLCRGEIDYERSGAKLGSKAKFDRFSSGMSETRLLRIIAGEGTIKGRALTAVVVQNSYLSLQIFKVDDLPCVRRADTAQGNKRNGSSGIPTQPQNAKL